MAQPLMTTSMAMKQKLVAIRMGSLLNQLAQRTSAGVAKPNPNPHGWKSWRDIPDSMIPTTSKRDPDNPIYRTRKYVNYRKQCIWYQIDDGTPIYLKGGAPDYIIYYGLLIATPVFLVINAYHLGKLIFGYGKKK